MSSAPQSPLIYVVLEGNTRGPLSKEQVLDMVRQGQLLGETPAWKDGLANWKRLDQLVSMPLPQLHSIPQAVVQPVQTAVPAVRTFPPQAQSTTAASPSVRRIFGAVAAILGAVALVALLDALVTGLERRQEKAAYEQQQIEQATAKEAANKDYALYLAEESVKEQKLANELRTETIRNAELAEADAQYQRKEADREAVAAKRAADFREAQRASEHRSQYNATMATREEANRIARQQNQILIQQDYNRQADYNQRVFEYNRELDRQRYNQQVYNQQVYNQQVYEYNRQQALRRNQVGRGVWFY